MAKKYTDLEQMTSDELKKLAAQNSRDWYNVGGDMKNTLHDENAMINGILDKRNNTTSEYDAKTGAWAEKSNKTGTESSYDINAVLDQINKQAGAAPSYSSNWDSYADELSKKALEMSYDKWAQGDKYDALAQRYGEQGKKAMENVLAQMAARTGGLASSYAEGAASQKYLDYIADLEDVARQMYANERSEAIGNAELAADNAKTDYQKYLDALSQYGSDRTFAYNLIADKLSSEESDKEWAYKTAQQEQSDARGRVEALIGSVDSIKDIPEDLRAASGLSDAEINILINAAKEAAVPKQAYSSGGGKSGKTQKDDSGDVWDAVEDWAREYGIDTVDNYIKEHYKELGYGTQGAALAGWQNHLIKIGGWKEEGASEKTVDTKTLYNKNVKSIPNTSYKGDAKEVADVIIERKLKGESDDKLKSDLYEAYLAGIITMAEYKDMVKTVLGAIK